MDDSQRFHQAKFSVLLEYFFSRHLPEMKKVLPPHDGEPISNVCTAFESNCVRVAALSMLPAWLLSDPVGEMINELLERHRAGNLGAGASLTIPVNLGEIDARCDNPIVYAGLHGLLSSIVVSAWTVFETLAKDLWVAAVNARPKLLGSREKLAGKTLPVRILQKHGFDLRSVMGTLLAEKMSFDALDGAADAYESAFDGHPEICKPFRANGIRAAHAIRNALVHNSGMVDADFKKQMPATEDGALHEGDEIHLDGKSVSELVDSVITESVNLIAAVDHWLRTNPDSRPTTV